MKNKLLDKKKIPVLSNLDNKSIIVISSIAIAIVGGLVLKAIADHESNERIPY